MRMFLLPNEFVAQGPSRFLGVSECIDYMAVWGVSIARQRDFTRYRDSATGWR